MTNARGKLLAPSVKPEWPARHAKEKDAPVVVALAAAVLVVVPVNKLGWSATPPFGVALNFYESVS